MRALRYSLFVVLVALLSACATTKMTVQVEPQNAKAETESFAILVTPNCGVDQLFGLAGCSSFNLNIINKTKNDMQVNWDKTLYIERGQTSGGFMFEGVVYIDRNKSKPADIIFAGSGFSKVVYPNNLVGYTSGTKYLNGWRHNYMPSGQNGIYLTMMVNGQEVNQKLVFDMSVNKESQ